ncbi:MAG TPA: histidine phosphatase family protein [Acetobacteraceae bacterium]|nr:histidine phosphatase family protein [Acetobacteraceae bacterium]
MAGRTTFHLIRHASYGLLGQVLAGRSSGHSLNTVGLAEAERLADGLARRPIVAVISSPLERAQETAAPIATRLGIEVQIDPDLNEIDFGAWTGRRFDVLHAAPEWQAFNVLRSATPIPGGETMLAAQARAVAAILGWRARWPQHELVVVSHGDVVKALLAYFLGVPIDLFRRLEIAPASRSIVSLGSVDVRVNGVNLPPSA